VYRKKDREQERKPETKMTAFLTENHPINKPTSKKEKYRARGKEK
jgi:hypothetical protein